MLLYPLRGMPLFWLLLFFLFGGTFVALAVLNLVIADRLASQFGADSVTVKASKPEPPIPLPVEEVSVEVWREEH